MNAGKDFYDKKVIFKRGFTDFVWVGQFKPIK